MDTPTRVYVQPMPARLPPRVETGAAARDDDGHALPPLDYGDARSIGPTLESTRPGRRYRIQHVRWFALGVAIGAIVAALGQGWLGAACHALRGRSAATTIHPAAPRIADPSSAVAAAILPAQPAPTSAPCPANGSSASPCAELLAPFQPAEVHTVSVDDLPRTATEVNPRQALTRGP